MKKFDVCLIIVFLTFLGFGILTISHDFAVGQEELPPSGLGEINIASITTELSTNFTGIWKAKVTGDINSFNSNSSECVVCAQVIPNCSNDQVIIPQSCNECSHCAPANTSGTLSCTKDEDCPLGVCSNGGTFKNYSCSDNGKCTQIFYFADPCEFISSSSGTVIERNTLAHLNHEVGHKVSKMLMLRLCARNGKLEGTIQQDGAFVKGKIISQEPISKNEVLITLEDKNGKTLTITLGLTGKRSMSIIFADSHIFKARKLSSLNSCSSITSSSSSSGSCAPIQSCRGLNGTELLCPEGTFCSGLPAYGCYPPNCPVPICCSPDTKIRTTGVQKRIADIKEGELVLSDNEKSVKVIKTIKTEVKNHKILKVKLNDATILEISPGHPTADGKQFKDLKMGDVLDGRIVVETKLIPYKYKYTYDILPDSKTGNYYANGVLIGSTLK